MVSDNISNEQPEDSNDKPENASDEVLEAKKEEVPPEKLEFKDILDKEIGLIKILDYVNNSVFDLIYQKKLMDKYRTEIIRPLIGEIGQESEYLDGGRLFLQEEYEKLDIEKKCDEMIQSAEELAAENGVRRHVQKSIGIISMVIMAVSMGIFIAVSTWAPDASTYVMIPMFLIICLLPNTLRTLMMKKWQKFKVEHNSEFIEMKKDTIEDIRIFIQDLINDTQDRLISNKISVQGIQFLLYSKDYDNLVFVRQQESKLGESQFLVHFTDPEGIGQGMASTYGKSGIPEDDANDQFIVLKNAEFDDEGLLKEYNQYLLPKEKDPFVEALLGGSKFNDVDNPEYVIANFKENDDIKCNCGEPVKLQDFKSCESILHEHFEYFLIIGEKCTTCRKNPFILFNSPGNKEIPSGLKQLFE
ncbi:hypothetical protein DSAG12_02478 [Promethearchaeum syntrophicum]|uniref:Uncharacterized protein n=1 Tax=Promethearchaeum syntrophicum TaxID=2594042 RepID=A0A5B9DBT4_9ARCH|nr:hypothetical protein [Candidatus Prometheoarchaeum syntrophicum]QEE16648.1 hypothetical protein DSAG12_02478 [Candidatus Prometheoarchaeum syntrophicum]